VFRSHRNKFRRISSVESSSSSTSTSDGRRTERMKKTTSQTKAAPETATSPDHSDAVNDVAQAIGRWAAERGIQQLLSGVNYFFGLTTTISPYQRQLLLESSAARSARRRAKPACGPVSVLREKPWRWESGKTCFWFFHFSIRPRRRSCGNVGISPAVGEISKGLVERGGSLLLAFHAFHSPGISTALFPGVFCFGRRPQTHSASPWLSAC